MGLTYTILAAQMTLTRNERGGSTSSMGLGFRVEGLGFRV